jgi:TetR/AcrR family transcriptional regulator, cholesterol catabolism regulator
MNPPSQSKIARRRMAAQQNPSPEYRERQRRVLEAAAHRFMEDRFDSADLSDIAADAGIERANIYYYVESKEDLYLQVLLEVKSDVVAAAERIARPSEPPAQRLRKLMVELMEELDRHYPFLYLHYEETTHLVAARNPNNHHLRQVLQLTERHFSAFRAVINDGVHDGSFATVLPVTTVAQTAAGIVLLTSKWWGPAKSSLSGAELGAALADLLLQGLSSPVASRPHEIPVP